MTLEEVLEESWAFQEMRRKAYEQAYKQGYKAGYKEGLKEGLQAQRQSLILLIQKYYPALLQLAQNVCNTVQALEELQELFEKVLYAKDEQEVRQILLSAQK